MLVVSSGDVDLVNDDRYDHSSDLYHAPDFQGDDPRCLSASYHGRYIP
jgi:hypothetical protein